MSYARPLYRAWHGHFIALDSRFGTATLSRKPIVRIPIDSTDSWRRVPVNIEDGSAEGKRPLLHPACPPPSSRIKDASRRFAVPKRASLTRLTVAVLMRL